MQTKLISKFLSFSIGNWLIALIAVVSTPIITRIFVPEELAKFAMFELAVNVLAILAIFGLDNSYVRFFYEEKKEDRRFLLRDSIKLPLILSFCLCVLLVVNSTRLSKALFGYIDTSLVYALAFTFLLMVIHRFAMLVLRMEQRGKTFSSLNAGMKFMDLLVLFLILIFINSSFEVLIYARILAVLMTVAVALFLGKNHWNLLGKKPVLKHKFSAIFKYGSPLLVTTLVSWLLQSFDRVMIQQMCSYSQLGIYVSAFNLVGILTILQVSFTTFWTPVAYESYEKGIDSSFYTRMARIVALIMFVVSVLTIMFKDVIILLLGSKYHDARLIVPFLVLIPMMYTISEVTVIGINFRKKSYYHLILSIVICLVNVLGNLLLIPTFGAVGAAVSTGLSYVLFLILRTYFSLRLYPVNYNLRMLSLKIVLLIVYASVVTFYDCNTINILCGLGILTMTGLLNRDLVLSIIHSGK